MEKNTPHCKLEKIKSLIKEDKVRATGTAQAGARLVGVANLDAMCAVIMAMTSANFFKSMTTNADHRVWQDVYHTSTGGYAVYVKLTVIDDLLIVSFKEK
ncbi:MAG: type II toxin-antitoxin system MqsR family toxin [bacterium]|nr:type II toxin-antitoxin system MqsR family toxin [bacterium]